MMDNLVIDLITEDEWTDTQKAVCTRQPINFTTRRLL